MFATILLADLVVRSVPLGVSLVTALVLSAGYAGLAYGLRVLLPAPAGPSQLPALTRYSSPW